MVFKNCFKINFNFKKIGFCRLIQLYYILKINVNQCPYIKNQKLNKETSTSINIPPPSSSTPSSISSESCIEMDFPLTIATVPFREIHSQFYSVVYGKNGEKFLNFF